MRVRKRKQRYWTADRGCIPTSSCEVSRVQIVVRNGRTRWSMVWRWAPAPLGVDTTDHVLLCVFLTFAAKHIRGRGIIDIPAERTCIPDSNLLVGFLSVQLLMQANGTFSIVESWVPRLRLAHRAYESSCNGCHAEPKDRSISCRICRPCRLPVTSGLRVRRAFGGVGYRRHVHSNGTFFHSLNNHSIKVVPRSLGTTSCPDILSEFSSAG